MKLAKNCVFFILLLLGICSCIKFKASARSDTVFNSGINSSVNSATFVQIENYMTAYKKMELEKDQVDKLKALNHQGREDAHSIFVFYNQAESKMEFSLTEKKGNAPLLAEGHYFKTRFTQGWDKFYLKTYATGNPFIQCWAAGYLEGVLSHEEIYYYYNNLHVFFKENYGEIDQLKTFFERVNANIESKLNINYFKTLNKKDYQKWLHYYCIRSQLEGLQKGYATMQENITDEKTNSKILTLLDFYFINSEGNFEDIKAFLRMSSKDMQNVNPDSFNTKENLKKVFNTDNIEDIWSDLITKGHCSVIAKLVKDANGKYDIFAGHNTWSSYSELNRTLKYFEFAFEEDKVNVGMKSKTINFSSYPGVLFSGDDFYLLDNKIALLQTTLTAVNKLSYKNIINESTYVPEFMRIMTTNFLSETVNEWFENYSEYKDHMYITQWTVIDYKVLKDLNNGKKVENGLIYLIEEVPLDIKGVDITKIFLENTYFGSFNLPYFEEHMKKLGLVWAKSKLSNIYKDFNIAPRLTILKHFQGSIKTLEDFRKLMEYNGYENQDKSFPDDPSFSNPAFGISARGDLIPNNPRLAGGIDFKIIDRELVDRMMFYTKAGPTKTSLNKVVNMSDFEDEKEFHEGIPTIWNFSPIYFGKEDTTTLFSKDPKLT